ncbi:hypothetical protein QQF64_017071 [Cirrhinus molitorella]|uniref:CCHC-type domain-containing protein n=1 Tax=Cirrhinus molitorella TaxID=172907 RepID=A0ABR3LLN8_9TELE
MYQEVRAGGSPSAPALPAHMPLNEMGPQDDLEAFIDLFKRTAEACLGKISLLERNPCFLVGQGQPARASRLFPFLHSLPIYLLTCFLPCWRCGDPGHFIDQCPVMEVGTLIQVQNAPQAAPNQDGMYQLPVSIIPILLF